MTQTYEVRDVLVSIKDVTLEFDGKRILDGITAEVRDIVRPGCSQGQVVGILGPSGIGKTVLSRILTGLQAPTSGTVTVCNAGKPIAVEAGLVGYVPQSYPLLRHRTVLGNLTLAARMAGRPAKEAVDKAVEYLKNFDLLDKASEYPARLSGGQRQRVAIAQQLLCSEHYIVMDEPFTGLDPLMKDKVCDLINQIALLHEDNTIFVVAHDIAAMISVADTLWVLGRNRAQDGTVASGTKIQRIYDLAAMGIAWRPGVCDTKEGTALIAEIKELFKVL